MTADAMHTQTGHVEAMNAMNIGWILILKDNQPGMYAAAAAHQLPGTRAHPGRHR